MYNSIQDSFHGVVTSVQNLPLMSLIKLYIDDSILTQKKICPIFCPTFLSKFGGPLDLGLGPPRPGTRGGPYLGLGGPYLGLGGP